MHRRVEQLIGVTIRRVFRHPCEAGADRVHPTEDLGEVSDEARVVVEEIIPFRDRHAGTGDPGVQRIVLGAIRDEGVSGCRALDRGNRELCLCELDLQGMGQRESIRCVALAVTLEDPDTTTSVDLIGLLTTTGCEEPNGIDLDVRYPEASEDALDRRIRHRPDRVSRFGDEGHRGV